MPLHVVAARSALKQGLLLLLCLSVPADGAAAPHGRLLKLILPAVLARSASGPQRHWGAAQRIGMDDDAGGARIAVDSMGNAMAVWSQSDGARASIWASRYVAGSGWEAPQLIETDDAGDAGDPEIGMDAAGNAVAVWQQSDGTRINIWSTRYEAGKGWGTAQLIETSGDVWGAKVALDAAGNAVAVWVAHDGFRPNMWASRYEAGAGWGAAQLIENNNTDGVTDPHIGIDAAGNAIAIWAQNYNGIYVNRYETGAGWGTAQRIDGSDKTLYAQITVHADGNAFAVWVQLNATCSTGACHKIWANRYTKGAGWGTAEIIQSNAADSAYSTQVAADAAGNALAVWQQWSDTSTPNSSIWSCRYTAGSGWGAAQRIYADSSGSAHFPSLAMNAAGDAAVAWARNANGRNYIWASVRTAGKGWGAAQQIEPEGDSNYSQYPCTAVDPAGNALAVWQRGNIGLYNIWAARYE